LSSQRQFAVPLCNGWNVVMSLMRVGLRMI